MLGKPIGFYLSCHYEQFTVTFPTRWLGAVLLLFLPWLLVWSSSFLWLLNNRGLSANRRECSSGLCHHLLKTLNLASRSRAGDRSLAPGRCQIWVVFHRRDRGLRRVKREPPVLVVLDGVGVSGENVRLAVLVIPGQG